MISVIVAVALLLRRALVVRIGAALLLVATLVAFTLSRTDLGIFGFTERGLEPSPQAALALVAEIVGLLLLAATLVPMIGPGRDVAPAPALATAGALVVVAVGAGALWAKEETLAAGPSPTAASTTTAEATTTTASSAPAVTAETTSPTTVAPTTVAPMNVAPTTAAPTTAAPSSGVVTVSIVDFAFEQKTLEISAGTTVEWVNNDSFAHSVVADDDTFVSERMEPGATFRYTFGTAGEFPYICGIHPSMSGTIVVTG